MRPTARQLVESISWSLDERVAPHIDDKWAASTLRSVHCLLEHLAARVDVEGPILHDDNADLAATTAELASALAHADGEVARARDDLVAAAGRVRRDPARYPTVALLTEENDARRGALDALVRALQSGNGDIDDDSRARALALVDAQLQRRLARDQSLFAPAFMSSTF